MARRIPIRAARAIAQDFDCQQVILLAWDGKRTHVVTYGRSIEDCDQAALGGDLVKRALGWPESLQGALPRRVAKLQADVKRLLAQPIDGELVKLLTAAVHALRSYQYGNAAPDLAKDIAGDIEAKLAERAAANPTSFVGTVSRARTPNG